MNTIREAGNDSLRRGNPYDALWKYSHAMVLCKDHDLPTDMVATLQGNCAQACLNLQLYTDAFEFASTCIYLNPDADKLAKVC